MGIGKEMAREEGYLRGFREGYMLSKIGKIPYRYLKSEESEVKDGN